MISRTLVVDDETGRILRTITAPPSMLAVNARPGESLFIITDDDGLFIPDAHVVVTPGGEIVLADGAPEGLTAPDYELQFIAV